MLDLSHEHVFPPGILQIGNPLQAQVMQGADSACLPDPLMKVVRLVLGAVSPGSKEGLQPWWLDEANRLLVAVHRPALTILTSRLCSRVWQQQECQPPCPRLLAAHLPQKSLVVQASSLCEACEHVGLYCVPGLAGAGAWPFYIAKLSSELCCAPQPVPACLLTPTGRLSLGQPASLP